MTTFRDFANQVLAEASLGTGGLQTFLDGADPLYWERAETFFAAFSSYLAERNVTLSDLREYAKHDSADYIKRAVAFRRTGRYPDEGGQVEARQIYADTQEMRKGMLNLALTQFLWAHHYRLYSFFIDCLAYSSKHVERYLEIGPGHGLYLAAAANHLGRVTTLKAVDISEGSLQITGELLRHLKIRVPAELVHQDATTLDAEHETYDFITAGELIEHLDDPAAFLRKLRRLLGATGRAFITSCANCPDRTHVYRFNTVQEIRDMLAATGYRIERECIAPSADLPIGELERKRFSISYAALVQRDIVDEENT